MAYRRSRHSSFDLPTRKWVHLATVMHANRSFTVYMDTKEMDGPVNGGAKSIGGARTHAEIGVMFTGLLDEVMVWNRDLSMAEVRQLYLSQK